MPTVVPRALAQRSPAASRGAAPKPVARTVARAVVAPESAKAKDGPIIINGQVRARGRKKKKKGGGPARSHPLAGADWDRDPASPPAYP